MPPKLFKVPATFETFSLLASLFNDIKKLTRKKQEFREDVKVSEMYPSNWPSKENGLLARALRNLWGERREKGGGLTLGFYSWYWQWWDKGYGAIHCTSLKLRRALLKTFYTRATVIGKLHRGMQLLPLSGLQEPGRFSLTREISPREGPGRSSI